MSEKIALYGGSFNPIHHGHLIAARAVSEQLGGCRVIFLPSSTPPHKARGSLIDSALRMEMVRLAIADEADLDISDVDLRGEGPSYTIDTIAHFRDAMGSDAVIHWIVGADSLAELASWHRAHELVDACRMITVGRPGASKIPWEAFARTFTDEQIASLRAGMVTTPLIEISATNIRNRVRDDLSIRYLVPDAVREFIEANRLYQ